MGQKRHGRAWYDIHGFLLVFLDDLFVDATSTEFDSSTQSPAIIFMPEISRTHMGGTMRLGLRPTVFVEGTGGPNGWSIARKLYGGEEKIWERHRHR